MNSNSTQRWLARAAMPLAFLLTFAGQVLAQCDITWPGNPNPVSITIVIDPITGNAVLNKTVTNSNGITSGICGPIDTDDKIRFYTTAGKTTFVQPGNPWQINFDCSDVGSVLTVWVAMNDGTSGAFSMNDPSESDAVPIAVTLIDQTPPVAGPAVADITVNSSDDGTGDCTITDLFASAFQDIAIFGINGGPAGPNEFIDNCLDAITVSYELSGATVLPESPAPFLFPYVWDAGLATFNVGTTLVTYRVYDDLMPLGPGNPLVMTVNVTVLDDEDPTITCPADQNVDTDAGVCIATISNLAPAAYSDNCAVTIVTWDAPAGTPSASPVTGINNLSATFPVGTHTVTFQAEDAAGGTGTCTFEVIVTDNEDPTITCPPSDTVSATLPPGCVYTAGVEFDHLTEADNCGVISVTNNINGSSTLNTVDFPLGLNTIVWTAEDAQGNTATCSLDVLVIDDLPPAGPDSGKVITVNVTLGDCSAAVSYEYPGLFFWNPAECTPPVSLTEGPAIVNGVVDSNFLDPLIPFDPFSGRMNFIFGAGATLSFPVGQTIIPYTWTDGDGNDSTEYIIVNVIENILPTAKCKPGTLTLSLNAMSQATLTVDMVNDGSFDNCALDTLYLDQTAFDCSDLMGTYTVTLTAEDEVGNTATCTSVIDVVDNIAPQVLCPGSQTVTTTVGCTADNVTGIGMVFAASPLSSGQYTDNCGAATVTWQLSGATTASGPGSVPAGQVFNTGVTTVTYTIVDAGGNNAVCNFSINVTDNTPPMWTGVGQANGSTISQNANMGGCLALVTWTAPTFTDACTPPVTVSSTHNPGTSFGFGLTTVTYTASDAAGNVRIHTFNVNVVDTQAPNAQCKNITVQLNGAGVTSVVAAQVDNLSTDNCFFTYTSPLASYNCNNLGPNNYTLQITDGSGNTATCVAVVTVADTIKPVALCTLIPTINLNSNGQFSLAATVVNNGSTDNTFPLCGLTYDISVGSSAFGPTFNFDCSFIGNQILTLRVTDAAGNTATCAQTVLIKDVTPPTITAPAGVTISCDAPSTPANTGTFSGVADNCDPAPVVILLADVTVNILCANSYTINRTWRATDASGNSTTTSQEIVVQDTEAPVFSIQDSIILQTTSAGCSVPLPLQLTQDSVSDNCTTVFGNLTITYTVDYPTPSYGFVDVVTPVVGSSISPASFPVGTTVVTWRVTDQCGRSTTKSVTVKVFDIHGPVFSAAYTAANCGKVYTLPNTSGACSNLFSWPRPNFGAADITDCLNFTVTEQISNNTVAAFLNLTNPFVYTTMSPFAIFPTAQFPVDTTTITYLAQDSVGNQSTCTITIIIEDTEAPTLICPPNQTILATCPTAQVPNYSNSVGISDNCSGNVQLTQIYPAGTTLGSIFSPNLPADSSVFTMSMIGFDGYNSDTCTFTVMLLDGDAPIPTQDSLPDLIDSCGTLIVFAPTALDPCNPNADTIYGTPSTPVGSFINSNPPAYQLNPGFYVITWNYNDGNGNISTQPQNITVLNDIFPPVAICVPNLTVNLDPVTGKAGIDPALLNNGSYDPNLCGPLTFSVSPDTVNCAQAGPSPTPVTLTVRDLKGNPATCTTSVAVRDITAPVLSGAPANITVEACDTIPAAVQLTATDACAGTSLVTALPVSTQTPAGGVGKYNYVITRTWTTSDPSGNTAVVTRTVTVVDTKKPVFTNAPTMVMVTTDPDRQTCDDTVSVNILPFVSDCATGLDLSVTNNKEPGDGGNLTAIFSVGSHIVTFTAKDTTGNTQTHTVNVVVKDGTPPTAVCINGVSAALQPSGTVVVNTAQFNNNSNDNCAGNLDLKIKRLDKDPLLAPSNTLLYDCSDADGVTQHPVKLFVTDSAGNMSMCETFIVIQDNVDPSFTLCPQDKVVVCTDPLSTQNHGTALVTDNCPANLTLDFDDVIVNDTSGQSCYLVERTWMVVDLAGNTAVCVQTFSVLDTVAPILSQYPPNVTISCSENLSPPSNITATDNCTSFVGVTFVQDTIGVAPGLCGQYSYTITRTRTAVDDCGNVESHTNTITVVDNTAPTFPGLADTIIVQSVNFPANDTCTVPVTLDLAQIVVDCAPVSELVVTNNAPHGNGGLDASGNYEVGTYKIHFAATDPCGNVGIDSVVVIVIDNSKPVAVCDDVVVALGTNGVASITPMTISGNLSTDNCGIDTMYLDVYDFDCSNLGINNVVLTVVDVNGNSNTCATFVDITLGNGIGFDLSVSATPESTLGANDGTVTAVATNGTGSYSYLWTTGDTTATITTGLPPGIYIVTVTDNGSGCVRIDTAIVLAGSKLTIIAGTASGTQGAVVQVPVSVDNFKAMIGMSFSLHVTNAVVGTIQGATPTGVLPGTLTLNQVGSDLTVFWVGNGTPLDLPNGTVVFHLNVQLGVAPVGSTSPVTIDGTPTALSFQRDSLGNIVPTMANLVTGMVMIDSLAAADIEIAGIIKTWSGAGTPVPGVNVALTGSVTGNVVTGVPGTYSFLVPLASNTTVTPSKAVTSMFSTGINVGDLLAIQNHASSVNLLANPFQWVAGDINGNNMVDLVDYLLVQQLILGTVQHYSNGAPDWKFIAANHTFPTPNPLSLPYPQSISHLPAGMSFLTDDFTAVRMGDVTGNAPVNNIINNTQDRTGEVFRFRLDEQSLRAGDLITVPFKASAFNARQAYQMTITFDPGTLELADVAPGVLPNFGLGNFGMAHLADGHLTNLWVNAAPLTLADGEVLFTLTFRVLENSVALSNVLRPTSAVTAAEALDAADNTMGIEFDFANTLSNGGADQATFALLQNQPNPFREQTTIGFRLPQAERATLRVFSMDGRLVKTVVGNFAQGFNTVVLQNSELGTAGIYWYELKTDTHSDRKKMILID